ncbi:MAG: DUF58 domain-containing protein [Planctomycetota bacterium]|nr:DUF58 domain-containing protein [Planctomycetota bacterium]
MRPSYRYHVTWALLVYLALTLFLAIGAVNSQNNLLFMAFGLALAAGLVSGVVSGAMMMNLSATRLSPGAVSVGSSAVVRYEISNRSRRLPAFALVVEEERPRRRLARGWTSILQPARTAVLHIAPRESVEVALSMTALRRGPAHLTGIRITTAFPFGLLRKSVTIPAEATLLVMPRAARLRREASSGLLVRSDSGRSSMHLAGRGDEFYGVREYAPGDSPRLISWRASARSGDLVVRENATPTAGSVWIILNLEPGAVDRPLSEADERAITLAASFITSAMTQGMDAGLAIAATDALLAPARGLRARAAALVELARIERAVNPDRDPSFDARLARLSQRSAVIVVHAGEIDPSLGPAGARHLSSADLERVTLAAESSPAPAAEGAR